MRGQLGRGLGLVSLARAPIRDYWLFLSLLIGHMGVMPCAKRYGSLKPQEASKIMEPEKGLCANQCPL